MTTIESITPSAGTQSAGENPGKQRSALRTYLEFAAAWAILKSLGLLPRPLALKAGQTIAALVRLTVPRLSQHARINLQLAFPEKTAAQRAQIERGAFRNLGRLLGEVSQFPRFNQQNISSVVTHVGLENYLQAKARGRGVILLTGHIGAWELSVFAHSLLGHPMSFLARRVDNPLVEKLAADYRLGHGNRLIDKKNSVREVMKTLKAGGVIGILADLNTSREEGVFCDFFGRAACTTAGIATLALRTGAVVVPGYLIWDEAAQMHHLHFDAPIATIETGNQKEDVLANTARYTTALEAIIRRHPDQWLWIHRRWRTRPEGEAEIY